MLHLYLFLTSTDPFKHAYNLNLLMRTEEVQVGRAFNKVHHVVDDVSSSDYIACKCCCSIAINLLAEVEVSHNRLIAEMQRL